MDSIVMNKAQVENRSGPDVVDSADNSTPVYAPSMKKPKCAPVASDEAQAQVKPTETDQPAAKTRPRGRPKKYHKWDPDKCEYVFMGIPESDLVGSNRCRAKSYTHTYNLVEPTPYQVLLNLPPINLHLDTFRQCLS